MHVAGVAEDLGLAGEPGAEKWRTQSREVANPGSRTRANRFANPGSRFLWSGFAGRAEILCHTADVQLGLPRSSRTGAGWPSSLGFPVRTGTYWYCPINIRRSEIRVSCREVRVSGPRIRVSGTLELLTQLFGPLTLIFRVSGPKIKVSGSKS